MATTTEGGHHHGPPSDHHHHHSMPLDNGGTVLSSSSSSSSFITTPGHGTKSLHDLNSVGGKGGGGGGGGRTDTPFHHHPHSDPSHPHHPLPRITELRLRKLALRWHLRANSCIALHHHQKKSHYLASQSFREFYVAFAMATNRDATQLPHRKGMSRCANPYLDLSLALFSPT